MKEYIDEMLHLTADIAEALLTLKDTGQGMNPELCNKISSLAKLAEENINDAAESADTCNDDDEQTGNIIANADTIELPIEVTQDAEPVTVSFSPEPIESENIETDDTVTDIMAECACASEAEQEDPSVNALPIDTNELDDDAPADSNEDVEKAEDCQPEEEADSTSPATIPMERFTSSQLRNAFTLNDVFLYQRTLFGGSARRFHDALEDISGLDSIDNLREYLANIQHINLKSSEAKDFIATIGQFFIA